MKIESIPKGNTLAEIEISYKPALKISSLPIICDSKGVYELFLETWDKKKLEFVEQFKLLFLNRANRVFGICTISTGGPTGTIADPKIIFATALKINACTIIMAHNHPSGNIMPSKSDIELSHKVKAGGKLLDISVLDHLIVTSEGYYSFSDEGAF